MASGQPDRKGHRTLRETPLSDAVDLPDLPLREVDGLPGEGGAHQVRDSFEQLRDMHGFLRRRRERFGPNFAHGYFGFVTFAVGEPELARELLIDRGADFSSRMGWDFSIGELFEGGLMLRDFDDHRAQRNIMQAAFRPGAMRGYLEIINPIIDRTLTDWGRSPSFRFFPAIKRLGLQIATELLLGESLDVRAGRKIGRSFVDAVNAAVAVVRRPVPPGRYWRGMRGRAFLERYFASQIEARRRSNRADMFSQLCRAEDEAGDRLSDEEIAQHMIFLVFAAHDTTSMEYDARETLVETDWVFKEALRLQPPGSFMLRRTVREVQLGPYLLPKNLSVSPVSRISHYLPDWWTDPDCFDPLRFSPERAEHRRHPGLYYPFGGGAHMCLGVHLATMQAKAFLYQFLRRYTVIPKGRRPVRFQPVPMPHPSNSLPIGLVPTVV